MKRIELHCHLDGSVRPATISRLAMDENVPLWAPEHELGAAPATCSSLTEFLTHVARVVPLLQTPESLHRVSLELAEDWGADGVICSEVRFAPQLHLERGMSLDRAIEAVAEGLRDGMAAHKVDAGMLLCCLRKIVQRLAGSCWRRHRTNSLSWA